VKRIGLFAAVVALAGCGGGGGAKTETLYSSQDWSVVLNGGKAEVLHRVNGKFVVDTSHAVTIGILGPKPGSHASNPPQVAISMHSKTPLVESSIWLDGNVLYVKGGGSPTNGTIYGAPSVLAAGTHTAVGYARTAFGGTAVTWTFTTGPPPKS
jgi:hypothetical protein